MKFLGNGPVNKVNRSFLIIKHLMSWINSTTKSTKSGIQRMKMRPKNVKVKFVPDEQNQKNRLFIFKNVYF